MGRRSLLSLLLLVLLVFGYGPRPSLAKCKATNPTEVYKGEKEITTKHSENGEAVYVTSFSVRPLSGFQSVNLTATAEAEKDGSKQTVLFSHLITADKCFKNDKWMKVSMWADLGKDPTLGFRVGDCWKECRADLGTATTGKLTLRWLNVTARGRSKWTNELSGKRCIKQLGQGRPSNVPNCGSQILQPPSSSTQTTLQPPSSSTQTTLQPPSSSTQTTLQPPSPSTQTTLQPPSPFTQTTLQPPSPSTQTTLQPPSPSTQTTLQPPSPSTQTTQQPFPASTKTPLQPPSSSQPHTSTSTQPSSPFRLVGASVVIASVVAVTGAMLVLIGVCLRKKKKRNAPVTDAAGSSTHTEARDNSTVRVIENEIYEAFSDGEGAAGRTTEVIENELYECYGKKAAGGTTEVQENELYEPFSCTQTPVSGRTKVIFKNAGEGEMEEDSGDYIYEIL
ncbi:mucin-5B-like isoform X2 [Eriocheir sinensis]|uniref:mucin-5B-like isoform X2 n=1 Tax=Eriocheir sinensis TaxID=95602 RepID=UPI0021C605C7|nr:mucin-5B-like isoform X2 [Eriocheir sinensis]